jgi:hypothetical protein
MVRAGTVARAGTAISVGRKFLPSAAFRRVGSLSSAAVRRLRHPGINLMIAHLAAIHLTVVYLTVIYLTVIHSAGRASRISRRLRATIAGIATGMAAR